MGTKVSHMVLNTNETLKAASEWLEFQSQSNPYRELAKNIVSIRKLRKAIASTGQHSAHVESRVHLQTTTLRLITKRKKKKHLVTFLVSVQSSSLTQTPQRSFVYFGFTRITTFNHLVCDLDASGNKHHTHNIIYTFYSHTYYVQ